MPRKRRPRSQLVHPGYAWSTRGLHGSACSVDGYGFNVDVEGVVVPYTRLGRERWSDRAQRYLSSRDALAAALRDARAEVDEDGVTVARPDWPAWRVTVKVERWARTADTDNIVKALLDAAQTITVDGVELPGIFADDSAVMSISAHRTFPADGVDRMRIRFEPVPNPYAERPRKRPTTA